MARRGWKLYLSTRSPLQRLVCVCVCVRACFIPGGKQSFCNSNINSMDQTHSHLQLFDAIDAYNLSFFKIDAFISKNANAREKNFILPMPERSDTSPQNSLPEYQTMCLPNSTLGIQCACVCPHAANILAARQIYRGPSDILYQNYYCSEAKNNFPWSPLLSLFFTSCPGFVKISRDKNVDIAKLATESETDS